MSNSRFMDQFGNEFFATKELSRGGQGVVYRTDDKDIAVKIPLGPNGEPDFSQSNSDSFYRVRSLPVRTDLHIALPISVLKNSPGYAMKLLNEMEPFGAFYYSGDDLDTYSSKKIPE